ncbi:MAG: hypothetical protein HQM03_00605 [Magnetococcales bacterium]|nr:hypothetical protein [Magnetococcales bacterium]
MSLATHRHRPLLLWGSLGLLLAGSLIAEQSGDNDIRPTARGAGDLPPGFSKGSAEIRPGDDPMRNRCRSRDGSHGVNGAPRLWDALGDCPVNGGGDVER